MFLGRSMKQSQEKQKEFDLESQNLEMTKEKLFCELSRVKSTLAQFNASVNEIVKHVSSEINSMDNADRASLAMDMDKEDLAIFELIAKEEIVTKQTKNPYFARIDFKADDEEEERKYYLGISNLSDDKHPVPYICDWRAPVASMYYDFEIGEAFYDAPMGRICGNISKKRQISVKDGKLEYFFDSDLTIGDEILKQTLSHTTDTKMKNIVSTIQKEQNAIIRSDINKTLVVQGVAGSGKTSVALHRIAFLLYRFKERIKAKNILILSPNRIFSDYISNVLPELGEKNVMEITFGELAFDELRGICPFEDRSEMTDDVLAGNIERAKEINSKSTFEFALALEKFLKERVAATFVATDIVVGEDVVLAEKLQSLFDSRYAKHEIAKRIEWIADYVVDELKLPHGSANGAAKRIKNKLYKMFENIDIIDIYEQFLTTQNMTLKFAKSGVLRYEDVGPVLAIKDYILGINTFKDIKYLLVDEMQDYDPVSMALVCKMFKCPKTVLGDIHQTFEKQLDDEYLKNLTNLFGSESFLLRMNKSYRSTSEISKFAQRFVGVDNMENVSRHGKEPLVCQCQTDGEMIEKIACSCQRMLKQGYTRVAVVCKTEEEAKCIHKKLSKKIMCNLMQKSSNEVLVGTIVTSAALSKGLEFDGVIIPNVSKKEYNQKVHENCLYISSSRALHELELYYVGEISNLIKQGE